MCFGRSFGRQKIYKLQVYNSGFESGLKDGYGFEKSNILANWNYATMMLSSFDYPTKAALEFGVKNMPENQTMGYIDAVANASAEETGRFAGYIADTAENVGKISKSSLKETVLSSIDAVKREIEDTGIQAMPHVMGAGELILNMGKGKAIDELTNNVTKKALGEPEGIPKNREALKTSDKPELFIKPENILDSDNPAEQLLKVGRKLLMLGVY